MGGICNTPTVNSKDQVEMKPHVHKNKKILNKYNSLHDNYYEKFDCTHNLLKSIELTDFMSILSTTKFHNNNNTRVRSKRSLFTEDLDKMEFLTFINCKIINHPLVYHLKETNSPQILTDFFTKIYDVTGKALVSFASEYKKRGKGKLTDKKVKKYLLLAIGILFCHSDDSTKIKIFFNAFANEKNNIQKNLEMEMFLYVVFLICSFGGMYGLFEMAKLYPDEISKVNAVDYSKALDIYEASDMFHIGENYLKALFGDLNVLTYEEYYIKITSNGLDWIFTGSGVRQALENNDIETGSEK